MPTKCSSWSKRSAEVIVCKNAVVSLEVELWDIWDNLLDKPAQPLTYLHGGHGDVFPAIEAALEGKAVNDAVEVRLEPEDAFGEYDEDLLQLAPRADFPDGLEVGMRVEAEGGDVGDSAILTVTDIAGDKVVLDGNHPYAGIALKFKCTVVDVRPASEAELANGSADDPDSVIVRALP